MAWIKKEHPHISGYESVGRAGKRWLDFKINELLDTGDPVWEYRGELRSRKEICEFVIREIKYPISKGKPTDRHSNNWFDCLCCHTIHQDFWQKCSDTLQTLRLNQRMGEKGYGDCEDSSCTMVNLFEMKRWNAYECFGWVCRGGECYGHGWGLFEDEQGAWRLYESTLEQPPKYPEGYQEIDPDGNDWRVGDLRYRAVCKFNRHEYYEWEGRTLGEYTRLGFRDKNKRRKFEWIEEDWGVPTKPIKLAGRLGRVRRW